MIVDHLLELADAQTLSGASASQNTIDFGQEAPTTGMDGLDIVLVVSVAEDVSGTFNVAIQHSDEETTGFTDAVVSETLTAPLAGTQVVMKLPYEHKRYARAYFGGSPTAGVVNAVVTTGFDANKPFKQAQSVQSLYEKAE